MGVHYGHAPWPKRDELTVVYDALWPAGKASSTYYSSNIANWGTDSTAPALTTGSGNPEVITAFPGYYNFDGNDGYNVPDSNLINTIGTSNFTRCLWFNAQDTKNDVQVIWEEGGTTNSLTIYLYSGSIFMGYANESTSFNGSWLSSSVDFKVWNHICIARTGPSGTSAACDLYLNAVKFATITGTQLSSHTGDCSFGFVTDSTQSHLGDLTTGNYYSGSIALFGLYTYYGLTDKEVEQIYNGQRWRFGV